MAKIAEQYKILKETIKNKDKIYIQKSLETMIDFYKTRTPSTDIKLNEENMKLWINDVLPLIFDEFTDVRISAICALEEVIAHLNFANLQNNPFWPAKKTEIFDLFQIKIDKNQIEVDPNWDRIWSLMVRLMHNNIIEGASTINKFLSVVERGFRSADLNTRYKAFNCWQTLVEIFAQHGQLISAKRLKLILVPLKSSKSKTEGIAQQKFKIWWHLISAYGSNLHSADTSIWEPFIHFCFAPFSFELNSVDYSISPGKSYPSIRPKAVVAFCTMLGMKKEAVLKLAAKEKIDVSKSVFSPELLKKRTELIIRSCLESTKYLHEIHNENFDAVAFNYEMWTKLMNVLSSLNINIQTMENDGLNTQTESKSVFQIMTESLSKLYEMKVNYINDDKIPRMTADIVKAMAKSGIYLPKPYLVNENVNVKIEDIKPFIEFVFRNNLQFSEETLEDICTELFNFKKYANGKNYFEFLGNMIAYMANKDFSSMASRRHSQLLTFIWITMSMNISDYLVQQKQPFSTDKLKKPIDFLLWPFDHPQIINYVEMAHHWRVLYTHMNKLCKESLLANLLCDAIKFTLTDRNNSCMPMVVKYYNMILEIIPTDLGTTTSPVDTLDLLTYVLKNHGFRHASDDLTETVDTLNDFFHKISPSYFFKLATYTKNIAVEVAHLKNNEEMNKSIAKFMNTLVERSLSATFHEEIKSQNLNIRKNCKLLFTFLQQNIDNTKKKSAFKNIIDACTEKENKKDEFVPISNVWKFTPDKLTDHQKEKMREKRNDIPALYNDMSMSQDSFIIKPWTPNKVVIPSTEDTDTIIMNASDSEDISKLTNKMEEVSKNNKEDSNTIIMNASDSEDISKLTNKKEELSEKNKEDNDKIIMNASESENIRKLTNKKEEVSKKNKEDSKIDKENNNRSAAKSSRKNKEMTRLLIDMVEGNKALTEQIMTKKNGRRSSISTERELRPKRTKEQSKLAKSEVKKKVIKNKDSEKGGKKAKNEEKSSKKIEPVVELIPKVSLRKSLNFDDEDLKLDPIEKKENDDESQEVVECSQIIEKDRTLKVRRSMIKTTPCKIIVSKNELKAMDTLPIESELSVELSNISANTNTTNVTNTSQQSQNDAIKISEMDTELNTLLDISKTDLPPSNDNSQTTMVTTEVMSVSSTETIKALDEINDFVTKSETEMDIDSSSDAPSQQINENSQSSSKSDVSTPLAQMDTVLNTYQTQQPPSEKNDVITIAQMDTILNSQKPAPDVVVPEENSTPTKTEALNEKTDNPADDEVLGTPTLSPIKNLEDEMTPLSKSPNKSIMSSPEGNNFDERNADLLNNTLNISPIAEDKIVSLTPVVQASEKKPVALLKEKEKTIFSSPVNRTQKMFGSAFISSPSTISKTPQLNSPSSRNIALSGRGAQLINLSRNRKNESTPKQSVNMVPLMMQAKCSPTNNTNDINGKIMVCENNFDSPKPEPPKHRDLLVFSKVLPSPKASPSVSILKRKLEHDHDDFESPINKKKRVSFHDPPVSASKEYIVQEEENRQFKEQTNGTSKLSLRRKSKADCISELAKFSGPDNRNEDSESPELEIDTTNEMSALHVTTESVVQDAQDIEMSPPEEEQPEAKFKFDTEEDIFKFITDKYSNAELIEKISNCSGKSLVDNVSAKIITKNLSNLMTQDDKMKHAVLDQLSEKHSSEFLDHAIQENSSTVVCDRLAVPTMIEYIFRQIKTPKTDENHESHIKQVVEGVKEACNTNKKLMDEIALFALQRQTSETFYGLMQTYFKST